MSVPAEIAPDPTETARTLAVALGGASGALLRFAVELLCAAALPASLALTSALLAVNLLGAALLGVLAGRLERRDGNPLLTAFLGTGLCGAFTTFSGFTLHLDRLHQTEGQLTAAIFFVLSLAGGASGYSIGRLLGRRIDGPSQ